jgi:hypothetical protein
LFAQTTREKVKWQMRRLDFIVKARLKPESRAFGTQTRLFPIQFKLCAKKESTCQTARLNSSRDKGFRKPIP